MSRATGGGPKPSVRVQQLLGHSSVAVTAVYSACDDDEIRAAMMGRGVVSL